MGTGWSLGSGIGMGRGILRPDPLRCRPYTSFYKRCHKDEDSFVSYISTNIMIIDPLSKPILRYDFKACVTIIGLHRV